jgi:predicted transcriptional regulator
MGCGMRQNHYKIIIGLGLLLISICVTYPAAAQSFRTTETVGYSLAAIVAIVAAILAFMGLWGGVKYVTPENVLNTEVRKNLYEYINTYPGSHLREISRELQLKPSNAAWHLRKLEQTNLVRSRVIGGKKVFYLVEGGIESRKRAIAESILRNQNAREIMEYLNKYPGKHLLEIAHALELNHHVVKWHIKKLDMAELVEGDTSNSVYPVYYPTEIGSTALEELMEYPPKNKRVAS